MASSISSTTKSADLVLIKGTIFTLSISNGFPIDNFSTFSFTLSTRASATLSTTKTLFTAVHLCPEYEKAPDTILEAVKSKSASSNTIAKIFTA